MPTGHSGQTLVSPRADRVHGSPLWASSASTDDLGRGVRSMLGVLHQLIDRAMFRSEDEVRRAHAAVDAWFGEHYPAQPADSTVDQPHAVASSTSDDHESDSHSA